jgi:transcriptional regulator GlxA family with amidase domain
MPETSVRRFSKKRSSNPFINTLNEIRQGHATRLLPHTTHRTTEVAYKCGFNNSVSFDCTFKEHKY